MTCGDSSVASGYASAELVTQTGTTIALFGAYVFIAYCAVRGSISLGDLVMYFQALQRGQAFLQEMLRSLAGLYEDSLFLSSYYEFLDLERKVVDPPRPTPVPRPMRSGIKFDRVSFRYPQSGRSVLEDITLTIRPGEVSALVGENGSGKTTLVKLLCRLYDPTEGTISIDGIDLRRFAAAELRQQISIVFQDYVHYHATAREKVWWFGNVDLPPDATRIKAAAGQAGADEVIARLPHGYDTVLGKRFEEGEELSMGEWQKVAVARAFLRDAQILVLDEPTSALDAKAEYEAYSKFRELVTGRTAILISHRLSTVKMADCVYVLERGRIVERGTHDELMLRGGTYAHLFETQPRQYR